MASSAAVVALAAGIASIQVRAVVKNLVLERMESIPQEEVQAADGISEEEAIEIARKQMESELGEKAAGMELLVDIYGCSAFLNDISNQTTYEHERDVAYIVGFHNLDDHSSYTCTIDAVDGSILHIAQ